MNCNKNKGEEEDEEEEEEEEGGWKEIGGKKFFVD